MTLLRLQNSTLVVVQPKGNQVGPEALSAVTAAKAIGGDITVLIAGKDLAAASNYASKIKDVSQVIIKAFLKRPTLVQGIKESLTSPSRSRTMSSGASKVLPPCLSQVLVAEELQLERLTAERLGPLLEAVQRK